METKIAAPTFRNSISFKVGGFLAICIIIGDVLAFPIYDWVVAQYGGWGAMDEDPGWLGTFIMFGLSVGYAIAQGIVIGLFAAKFLMSRLRRISAQIAEQSGSEIPGPFAVSGKDEIAQLARALNSMREEIVGLVDNLEERNRRRQEWVAQVSHDLRTPLTALTVSLENSQQLLDDDGGSHAQQLRANNQAARIDADRVGTLAEDLLDIARLEVERTLVCETILIGEVVDQLVCGMEPLATSRGLSLRVELAESLPMILADGRLLLRAMENLVINSIQHAERQIVIKVVPNHQSISIAVEDDGPGLPPQATGSSSDQQWTPVSFAELKKHRSRPDSAGLGLLVAERVAQAHRGRLEASNRVDQGAEIRLVLPI